MRAFVDEPEQQDIRLAVLERALPPPSLYWRLRDMNACRLMSAEMALEQAADPAPLTIFARRFPHRFMHDALVKPNVALVEIKDSGNGKRIDPHVDLQLGVAATDAEIEFCVQHALEKKKERYDYLQGLGMINGDDGVLLLSNAEKQLLALLLYSRDSVVLKENLAHALWGVAADGAMTTSRAIDTLVYRLRRKLNHVTDIDIETVRSRGFRLIGKDGVAAQHFRNVFQGQELLGFPHQGI